MNLSGHLWTIWPSLASRVRTREAPPARAWETELEDPQRGRLRLSGLWAPVEGAQTSLIVIHGMGGSVHRPYCLRAAEAARARGWNCLRLALRGADRRGEDFYHAGLHADIHAAVSSAELASSPKIYLLGYSLGGHVALRYLSSEPDERVVAGAAVCAPVDLDAACRHLDENSPRWYRRHILSRLHEIYAAVAARGPVPNPVDEVRCTRFIRDFDRLTIVPRYGFGSVDAYYAAESVAPQLHRLARPTLLCQSTRDPMLPPSAVRPFLGDAPEQLSQRWVDAGGHVSFPASLSLGLEGPPGLEQQLLSWLHQH